MKVFFSASPRGEQQFGRLYKKIYEEVKNLGYSLVDHEIITDSHEVFMKKMQEGQQAYVDRFRKKMQAIQGADICLFEASMPSLGIGFLIQKALENSKPTVVVYYKDNVSYTLSGASEEQLIVRNYNDKNVRQVLREAFELAKERRDKRFNFFISPKLLNYIEMASHEQGITKSKFIRNLIIEHMHKNQKG